MLPEDYDSDGVRCRDPGPCWKSERWLVGEALVVNLFRPAMRTLWGWAGKQSPPRRLSHEFQQAATQVSTEDPLWEDGCAQGLGSDL